MTYQTLGVVGVDEAVCLIIMILYDSNIPQTTRYRFIERFTRFSNYPQIRAVMQKSDLAELDSVLAKAADCKALTNLK